MDEDSGSTFKQIATAVVLVLFVTSGVKVFQDLHSNPSACRAPRNLSSSSSLDLAPLVALPWQINPNTTATRDLRNSTFWSLVASSFGSTISSMIPQTVLGFIQGSQAWKNWTIGYMADPPPWVNDGPIPALDAELNALDAESVSSVDAPTALGHVEDFATSVDGYTLEALDFVSFNGLTSLKTYFETGSTEKALCASFPGQLAQLYSESFDQSVPSSLRAQTLGAALAITSVMVLLGGLGGFSEEFKQALANSGLDGAWDTMKPSFQKLGAISPDAANLALTVLQHWAVKYPDYIGTDASFTADRIDSMAEVLHDSGDPVSDIEQKIGSLVQAADSSTGPDDVATDADVISYDDGGGLRVTFDTQYRMYEYTEDQTMRRLPASLMEEILPGFIAKDSMPIAMYYEQLGKTVYYYYSGGGLFQPTGPSDLVRPGDTFTVRFSILNIPAFIQSLPGIDFVQPTGFNWIADVSHLTGYSLQGDQLTLDFAQEGAPDGLGEFSVTGQTAPSIGSGSVSGTYLDVYITDLFNDDRTLRIYYNGYGSAAMAISVGTKFAPLEMVSFDGVRETFVYEKGASNERATLYAIPPDTLYKLGSMDGYSLPYAVTGYSYSFFINDVSTFRDLEYKMASEGTTTDVGRVGAEIAYTVAVSKLDLKGVIMPDPVTPGADLYTPDKSTIIEARMLQRTMGESSSAQAADISAELNSMVDRILNYDFKFYPNAEVGYVVFSYLDDSGAIHTIVLQVDRP